MPKTHQNQKNNEGSQLEALQSQIANLTEALKRERADAINQKRRHEDTISSLTSFHKALVIKELLPVIDNFERSIKAVPEELKDNDYIKGVFGIVKQFEAILQKLGVEKINTVGHVFDPVLHEAVSMDGSSEGSVEIVSDELQSGYKMGDEIIRHAMVNVKMGEPGTTVQ